MVSGGQCSDNTQVLAALVLAALDAVRVPRQGRGRPRKRPGCILGDKGYSYPSCRRQLRGRGLKILIPERRDQREQRVKKRQKGGRPCRFDRDLYKERNIIERTFLRLKQSRRVATRYDKTKASYQAFVTLASIRLWLR